MTKSTFIHIPKTGGRSVLAALGLKWSSAHSSISDLEKSDPAAIADDVFKFTVVRNPWERVVSIWMFFGHMGSVGRSKDFSDWLSAQHGRFVKSPNVRLRPTISQRQFCVDSKGKVSIDQFLRFENLTADFDAIASKVSAVKSLPTLGLEEKANTIRMEQDADKREILADAATDYHTLYNDKLVDMVRDMDAWTVDTFKYSFDDPAPALSQRQQEQITLALSRPIRLPPIKAVVR